MADELLLKVVGDRDQGLVDEFRFIPGEERTLRLQLVTHDGRKWSLPTPGTGETLELELTLAGTPDDVVVENSDISIDLEDRSMIYTTLDEANTVLMITGQCSLKIEHNKGGAPADILTRFALGEHTLKKVVI